MYLVRACCQSFSRTCCRALSLKQTIFKQNLYIEIDWSAHKQNFIYTTCKLATNLQLSGRKILVSERRSRNSAEKVFFERFFCSGYSPVHGNQENQRKHSGLDWSGLELTNLFIVKLGCFIGRLKVNFLFLRIKLPPKNLCM